MIGDQTSAHVTYLFKDSFLVTFKVSNQCAVCSLYATTGTQYMLNNIFLSI